VHVLSLTFYLFCQGKIDKKLDNKNLSALKYFNFIKSYMEIFGMSLEISPTFWVAFSFFVFIIIVWSTLRSSFLTIIHNYKISISSYLNDIYSEKTISEELLERSNKELSEASSNIYVLNAHKVAKTISEASKERITYIRRTINNGMKNSIDGLEIFLENKTKNHILSISSKIVEEYIFSHKEEFNKIATKRIKEVFTS